MKIIIIVVVVVVVFFVAVDANFYNFQVQPWNGLQNHPQYVVNSWLDYTWCENGCNAMVYIYIVFYMYTLAMWDEMRWATPRIQYVYASCGSECVVRVHVCCASDVLRELQIQLLPTAMAMRCYRRICSFPNDFRLKNNSPRSRDRVACKRNMNYHVGDDDAFSKS